MPVFYGPHMRLRHQKNTRMVEPQDLGPYALHVFTGIRVENRLRTISRLARVVAWLEDMASNRLDCDEAALQRAGGARIQFSQREGLPLDTLEALRQRASKPRQGLVTDLDPDAATR